jgi:tripartite-type tricarboxylate transporter receptor subunit TctC
VISVRPDSSFRTLGELIAYAKANPGKLNFPSSGIGTVHHLSGELLNAMAGVEMVHVPFRGGASPLTEVLGGRVDLLLEAITLSIGQLHAGKLRALAVTSASRWPALAEVPTVAETVPGYEATAWFGIGMPKNTPREFIEKINAEVNRALADPTMRAKLAELGGRPIAGTPEDFGKVIAAETAKWEKVVISSGAKVD